MAADYAALEARVSELEREIRHVVPAKIDAVAYGLSLVHEDVRAMRSEQRDIRAEQLRQSEALAEILRRLPPPPG